LCPSSKNGGWLFAPVRPSAAPVHPPHPMKPSLIAVHGVCAWRGQEPARWVCLQQPVHCREDRALLCVRIEREMSTSTEHRVFQPAHQLTGIIKLRLPFTSLMRVSVFGFGSLECLNQNARVPQSIC